MQAQERVAVIGAGLLGRGIALVAARAGFPVNVYDSHAETLDSALAYVRAQAGRDAAVIRAESIEAAVADAMYVIESVIEDLPTKQRVFAQAGQASASAVLMSNSSCLPIGEIARDTPRPARTVGAHWWNPPQLIEPVEVIASAQTSPETFERTVAFVAALGKVPVRVARDLVGFIGNRLQHALAREALALVSDGVAEPDVVDRLAGTIVGTRLIVCGPLAEMDRLGHAKAADELAAVLPRLNTSEQPAPLLLDKIARGDLGAKTGRGFRVWAAGERERVGAELAAYVGRRVSEPSRTGEPLPEFGTGLSAAERQVSRQLRAALWHEALWLLEHRVADAPTIDFMACRTFGLRLPQMGPITHADFVGLDLIRAVHERLFPTFDRPLTVSSLLSEAGDFCVQAAQ